MVALSGPIALQLRRRRRRDRKAAAWARFAGGVAACVGVALFIVQLTALALR